MAKRKEIEADPQPSKKLVKATEIDQLEALYVVSMEIIERCQACVTVRNIKLTSDVKIEYESPLSYTEILSKCRALMQWDNVAIGISLHGHDWKQLRLLVDQGYIRIEELKQKLEDLQVAAGAFESRRIELAKIRPVLPNREICWKQCSHLPLACKLGDSRGELNLPSPSAEIFKAFVGLEWSTWSSHEWMLPMLFEAYSMARNGDDIYQLDLFNGWVICFKAGFAIKPTAGPSDVNPSNLALYAIDTIDFPRFQLLRGWTFCGRRLDMGSTPQSVMTDADKAGDQYHRFVKGKLHPIFADLFKVQ